MTDLVFSMFPFKTVVDLEFRDFPDRDSDLKWSQPAVIHNLSMLDQLRVLRFTSSVPCVLLQRLLRTSIAFKGVSICTGSESCHGDDRSRLLPSLEHIALTDISFDPITPYKPNPTILDLILAFIWTRYRGSLGSSITKVTIRGCQGVTKETLRSIKFFSDVTWDGQGEDLSEVTRVFWEDPLAFSTEAFVAIFTRVFAGFSSRSTASGYDANLAY